MTHFDIFSERREPFRSLDESARYLDEMREHYSVHNLSYWFLGADPSTKEAVTWLSTYSRAYMDYYMSHYAPTGDPAFGTTVNSLIPLDWNTLRYEDDATRSIEEYALSCGIGKQGISFPIRDPGFGQALFSVNFACADEDWFDVRKKLVSTFHLFGFWFHLRLKNLLSREVERSTPGLTPREKEVLGWAAQGKTAWETASLLGISERAVRLYTENAMAKLNAHTKTQAVAQAIKSGLIT